jgi:hypothetical protein
MNPFRLFIIRYIINPPFKEEVMKYIISEGRLDDLFEKFMDLNFDLRYNPYSKQFRSRVGESFGDLIKGRFYYGSYSTELFLNRMFGDITNDLLDDYLRKKFPDIGIKGVE